MLAIVVHGLGRLHGDGILTERSPGVRMPIEVKAPTTAAATTVARQARGMGWADCAQKAW